MTEGNRFKNIRKILMNLVYISLQRNIRKILMIPIFDTGILSHSILILSCSIINNTKKILVIQ